MEKKKNIITNSLIASAIVACSSFNTNAAEVFHHNNLGSGEEIRTNLSKEANGNRSLELNWGGKNEASSDTTKNKKDHKCGKEHKCGKKGKDGKCGEGKCGKKKEAAKKEADKK